MTTEHDATTSLARSITYAKRLFECGLAEGDVRRIITRDHDLNREDALAATTLALVDDEGGPK